ncbi:hypothetical protein FE783_17165 [Paenibacillus mesophilus]|nr:hypothetical protein FE783_17165 [Paenibacillus mesophilus]
MKPQQVKPVIGICVGGRSGNRFNHVERLIGSRMERYSPAEADLIVFHLNDLNPERKSVTGLHCMKKGSSLVWERRTLRLPDAVFIQCHADSKMVNRLEQAIGKKVYNNVFLDKWQCWKFLYDNPDFRPFLPISQNLVSVESLESFYNEHKDVFIKPVRGSGGNGIVRVIAQKGKNTIKAIYHNHKKSRIRTFKEWNSIWNHFSLSPHSHMMQKSMKTVQWNGKPTDIRVNINKNGEGAWQVSCLFFRVALNGSHVGWGRGVHYMVMDPNWLLKEKIVREKSLSQIAGLGLSIGKCFDDQGYHMADLGIDFGLDRKGNPWIFEVNPLPSPFGPPILDQSWTSPIEYGVYLARKHH